MSAGFHDVIGALPWLAGASAAVALLLVTTGILLSVARVLIGRPAGKAWWRTRAWVYTARRRWLT